MSNRIINTHIHTHTVVHTLSAFSHINTRILIMQVTCMWLKCIESNPPQSDCNHLCELEARHTPHSRFPSCQCLPVKNTATLNVYLSLLCSDVICKARPAHVCTSWNGLCKHACRRALSRSLFGFGIAVVQLTGRGLITRTAHARPHRGAAPLLTRTKDRQTDIMRLCLYYQASPNHWHLYAQMCICWHRGSSLLHLTDRVCIYVWACVCVHASVEDCHISLTEAIQQGVSHLPASFMLYWTQGKHTESNWKIEICPRPIQACMHRDTRKHTHRHTRRWNSFVDFFPCSLETNNIFQCLLHNLQSWFYSVSAFSFERQKSHQWVPSYPLQSYANETRESSQMWKLETTRRQ